MTAPTMEEAARFGRGSFLFDGIPNTVMKVDIPKAVLDISVKFSADGMNAISIPADPPGEACRFAEVTKSLCETKPGRAWLLHN